MGGYLVTLATFYQPEASQQFFLHSREKIRKDLTQWGSPEGVSTMPYSLLFKWDISEGEKVLLMNTGMTGIKQGCPRQTGMYE